VAKQKRGERTDNDVEPAKVVRPVRSRSASTAVTARARAKAAGSLEPVAEEKKTLRGRLSERMLKIPFFRRRYAKRLIKYIDKSKAKGRPLPPQFNDLERFLAQVPKDQRAKRFEEALTQQQAEGPVSRDMRRAAANQQRRSGKNPAGYRPGSPPRSMQPKGVAPKRPR
jgi:hypothetical protein